MNILKKNIAPITDKAWEEIVDQASEIFKVYLTNRKFVDIEGPTGLEQGGVSTGRLILPKNQSKTGINYGLREVIPFVEIRKPFELDIWELDNIERGAKDVDLEPLENAAKEVALFEESAVFNGFKEGKIVGLNEVAEHPAVEIPENPDEFLKLIGSQVTSFRKDGVEGPYTLVIYDEIWQNLINMANRYPIIKQLKELTKGKVIINRNSANSYLVSERGGDFELILGQDLSIGYDGHANDKVKLYFTESFTFRVLAKEAVRILSIKK